MSGPVAYLLDTNVVSETRRRQPDPGVIGFLTGVESESLYLSVLTLGELRKGILRKAKTDSAAAKSIGAWADGLELSFSDRILGVDGAVARLWGEFSADRPRSVIDTLLAATAMVHGLTLVTRNISDVTGLPVTVLNPWG